MRTKLMGILNVTPDSFSDGGMHVTLERALAAVETFIADGAELIDIGAESTRPGATPVSAQEEWARLLPILSALPCFAGKVRFSVDTRHSDVAKKALAAGVHWINDVSGFSDNTMIDAVRDSDCMLVMMHSLSVPADKMIVMDEADVVEALLAWAGERIAVLEKSGISRSRVIFDPGIGFGKTAQQSLAILRGIDHFRALGIPLLIGHSRKSFLSAFGDRDDATLAVSQFLASHGVEYLRVHDVARHRHMLNIAEALDVR